MKEGYKTTELWVTVFATAFALLQSYGMLSADEAEAWLKLVSALIAVVPSVVYIWSRTVVKQNHRG